MLTNINSKKAVATMYCNMYESCLFYGKKIYKFNDK